MNTAIDCKKWTAGNFNFGMKPGSEFNSPVKLIQ